MIKYTYEKKYTAENLEKLFRSVNWLSADYPERLKKAIDHSETVITAWDDKELVGLANVLDDSELTAYVHYLCVNPLYHGKGIGKKLLSEIKEKYKDFLYIIVVAENEDLIKYYKANDFELIDGRYVFAIENKGDTKEK